MTFNEWTSLDPAGRDTEKRNWQVFEPGYWHTLASEAASAFAQEHAGDPHIQRICKSLYKSEELIIAVQTDCEDGELIGLPTDFFGFRVVQFANRPPEGVLVDVSPTP